MELKALLFENISAKQIVLKNSFWLYFANVIVKLFKFFLVVYAARILGPAQYGTFNYVLYLTGLFFIFSDLGIGSFLVREYQKREIDKNKIIPVGFLLKLISTIIPLLIAFFVYFYTEDLLVKSIFFVLLVMVIINNWRDFFASLSQANNRLEYNSGALIIEAGITVLFGLLFLFKTQSVFYFALAYLLGSLFSLIFIFLATLKYLPTFSQWRFDFASAKKLILFGLPFVLSSVVGFLLSIDIVMIKWLKDAELVGQYSVGSRIISLLFIIPAVFTTSLYPIFSKFYQDKEKLLNILRSSTSYMLMLALPLFLGGLLLAHRLVIGFFGSQYNLGVLSFKILLLSIPLYFLIVMLDYLLIALNYQVKNMLYTSVAAIVNVILAFLLIAKFSIYGAAIATVTARLINLALTYRLARKILGGNSIEFEAVARFALAAMVMTAFLFFINPIQISTLAIMLLAMILYFLALFVLQERNFLYLINVLRKVHLHT